MEGRYVTALQITYGNTMGAHRFHRVVDSEGFGLDIASTIRAAGGECSTQTVSVWYCKQPMGNPIVDVRVLHGPMDAAMEAVDGLPKAVDGAVWTLLPECISPNPPTIAEEVRIAYCTIPLASLSALDETTRVESAAAPPAFSRAVAGVRILPESEVATTSGALRCGVYPPFCLAVAYKSIRLASLHVFDFIRFVGAGTHGAAFILFLS